MIKLILLVLLIVFIIEIYLAIKNADVISEDQEAFYEE